jgi:hypothetical protein
MSLRCPRSIRHAVERLTPAVRAIWSTGIGSQASRRSSARRARMAGKSSAACGRIAVCRSGCGDRKAFRPARRSSALAGSRASFALRSRSAISARRSPAPAIAFHRVSGSASPSAKRGLKCRAADRAPGGGGIGADHFSHRPGAQDGGARVDRLFDDRFIKVGEFASGHEPPEEPPRHGRNVFPSGERGIEAGRPHLAFFEQQSRLQAIGDAHEHDRDRR